MTKTTAERLTYSDINKIVRLVKGSDLDVVGVLVAIEEDKEDMGIILHIGAGKFVLANKEIPTAEISFPCE